MDINRAKLSADLKEQGIWSCLSADDLLPMVESVHLDPNTGERDADQLMRIARQKMTPEFARKLMVGLQKSEEVDLANYDFGALGSTVVPNSVWMLTMDVECMVDPSQIANEFYREKPISDETARQTPGALPRLNLCTVASEKHPSPRWMNYSIGLPSSQKVLGFLKHSIATPFIGLKPCLPSHLFIQQKFEVHMPVLRPFLESLLPTFQWTLETPVMASVLNDVWDLGRRERFAKIMADANSAKSAGNATFAAGDRAGALKHYTDAIEVLMHGRAENLSEADIKQVADAAAYLVEGEGGDPKSAFSEAETAEHVYPSYVKPYFRQSIAHELLGDVEKAKEAIRRGLGRPELANDKALRDMLAVLESAGAVKAEKEG